MERPPRRPPASSGRDPTFVKKKTQRVLYARPNQHPGPCTFCRSAAHRLQTALADAHRHHHQNNQTHVEAARVTKTKVPDETYAAFMHGVCEDTEYWAHYKSFALETGGVVLAGADWSGPPRITTTRRRLAMRTSTICARRATTFRRRGGGWPVRDVVEGRWRVHGTEVVLPGCVLLRAGAGATPRLSTTSCESSLSLK